MLDTSTQLRLTGLATGLDTDAIIQQLGKAYNVRINAVKKDKQMLLWRQESYRSTINMVSTMLKSNFNAANPASNFRSANSFAKFSYNLSLGGSITDAAKAKVSSIVSVTANGDLKKFNQTIESVAQLATKDTWKGDKIDIAGITTKWKGGDGFNIEDLVSRQISFDNDGNLLPGGDVIRATYTSFALSIDGVSRTIMVDGVETKRIADMDKDTGIDPDDLKRLQAQAYAKALDDEIAKQFGKDYAGVVGVNGNNELTFRKAGSTLTINGTFGFDSIMTAMGLKGGATSAVGQKTIGEALNLGDLFKQRSKITIGLGVGTSAKAIEISETETISSLMTKINNSGAGVNLSYDSVGDRFVLTSTQEGSANNILEIAGEDSAKFFEALGIGKAVEVEFVRNAKWNEENQEFDYEYGSIYMLAVGGQFTSHQDFGNMIGSFSNILLKDSDGKVTERVNWSDPNFNAKLATGAIGTREEGKNLIAMINGEKYTRQTNTFTHEGMTFKFTETFNEARYNFDGPDAGTFKDDATAKTMLDASQLDPAIKIQVDKNTAEVVTSIKAFVEEYNKLIDHINGLLTEKRDRAYKPLTDDEKKAMTEEEITVYEAQAKSGIMANDSELRKLLDQMRSAIYQRVDGIGLTMSEIGITTSPNWKDGGRLVIDEGTLSNAIENRYDDVVALFTKPEVKIPEERDEKGNIIKKAYIEKQGGVALRLYNVLNDAAGLTGDKGYLVQKAGVMNDGSQMQNQMQKQLTQYDKRLDTLLERWYRKESQYYKMFARMESAMMKMQSQQNSLASLAAQGGK
jgi:flagellar hook-associated protein 2